MVISTIVGRRQDGTGWAMGAVKKRCRIGEIDSGRRDRVNLNNDTHICVSSRVCVYVWQRGDNWSSALSRVESLLSSS